MAPGLDDPAEALVQPSRIYYGAGFAVLWSRKQNSDTGIETSFAFPKLKSQSPFINERQYNKNIITIIPSSHAPEWFARHR
jgi:hypothetical protein